MYIPYVHEGTVHVHKYMRTYVRTYVFIVIMHNIYLQFTYVCEYVCFHFFVYITHLRTYVFIMYIHISCIDIPNGNGIEYRFPYHSC